MEKYDFAVSGTTYYACLDPNCSDISREVALPKPTYRRYGRGVRMQYQDVEHDAFMAVLDHMWSYWQTFLGGGYDDSDTPREGRAIRKDWERLVKEFGLTDGPQRPKKPRPQRIE